MIDIAKKHYFKTQERMDRVKYLGNQTVIIVSLIGSASAYLFRQYNFGQKRALLPFSPHYWDTAFIVVNVIIVLLIAASVYFLVRLLSSRLMSSEEGDEEIAPLPEVLRYKRELEDYCHRRPNLNAEEEFEKDMAEQYSFAAEKNRDDIVLDRSRIKWASLLCGIAGALVILSAGLYAGNRISPTDISQSEKQEASTHEENQANPAPQSKNSRGKGSLKHSESGSR